MTQCAHEEKGTRPERVRPPALRRLLEGVVDEMLRSRCDDAALLNDPLRSILNFLPSRGHSSIAPDVLAVLLQLRRPLERRCAGNARDPKSARMLPAARAG